MSEGLVRLNWTVDSRGYDIVWRDESYYRGEVRGMILEDCYVGDFRIERGGNSRKYEANLLEHEIFRDLVNSARRPGHEGVLEFVNKWGLLTKVWNPPLKKFLERRDSIVRALEYRYEDLAE